MLELVAQGKTASDRWRKVLLQNMSFELGRTSRDWAVGWDEKISRKHARMILVDDLLKVEKLPGASNPIYYKGSEASQFSIHVGEHFVIGDTTFLLTNDSALATLELPSPVAQRAFSNEYLRQIRYRDADHRIDVLNRLPQIISSSNNTSQLHGQMVNLLLAGIHSATAVGICRQTDDGDTEVIAWDQREFAGGNFNPCARLIGQALARGESTLHMWRTQDATCDMTVDLVNDWAFVCPLGGDANKGWAIYVAGVSRDPNPGFGDSDVNDLQGDVKFTELVGATLANLRRVQNLEERQSTFRPFFSPVVLEAFVDQEPEDVLRPRKCEISVLFCDLRGFSAKSEQMADQLEELLDRVSQALGIMTKTVLDYGGVIGDFHGDSAMGFWGWPLERQDTFESVCRAALAIQAELAAIAEQPEHRLHDFQMGIGVATGTAVAGKIGTSHQVKVTAFGPVVNLAARLEGMTRQLNIPILVDRRTAEQAGKYWQNSDVPPAGLRFLGRFRPFGLNVATDIYQLYAPMEALDPQVKVTYQNGWDQFRSSNWHESLAALQSIEKTDPAARFLSKYIRAHSLQKGFDGVIELRAK